MRAIFPAKNGVLVVGRAIRMVIRALIGITRGSCTQHASRRAKLKRRQHAVKPTKSTPFLRCCLVSKQASKTELIGIPNSKPPHDQQQSSSEQVDETCAVLADKRWLGTIGLLSEGAELDC